MWFLIVSVSTQFVYVQCKKCTKVLDQKKDVELSADKEYVYHKICMGKLYVIGKFVGANDFVFIGDFTSEWASPKIFGQSKALKEKMKQGATESKQEEFNGSSIGDLCCIKCYNMISSVEIELDAEKKMMIHRCSAEIQSEMGVVIKFGDGSTEHHYRIFKNQQKLSSLPQEIVLGTGGGGTSGGKGTSGGDPSQSIKYSSQRLDDDGEERREMKWDDSNSG